MERFQSQRDLRERCSPLDALRLAAAGGGMDILLGAIARADRDDLDALLTALEEAGDAPTDATPAAWPHPGHLSVVDSAPGEVLPQGYEGVRIDVETRRRIARAIRARLLALDAMKPERFQRRRGDSGWHEVPSRTSAEDAALDAAIEETFQRTPINLVQRYRPYFGKHP